jgi:replicative DNA helicase
MPTSVFYASEYRTAWQVLRDLLTETGSIDPAAFLAKLEDVEMEGTAADLMNGEAVRRTTLEAWADELRTLAHRRNIIDTCNAAAQQALEGADAPEVIESALRDAQGRHTAEFGAGACVDTDEHVDAFTAYCDRLTELEERGSTLRFGIEDVDRRAMWIPSYGLVLARTSHGKTAFALNVALSLTKDGKRPVYFSLEQPAYQIVGRLVSLLIGEPLPVALGQAMTPEQAEARDEALTWIRTSGLTIVDGRHTVDSILATAYRLKLDGKCDAAFIDQMSRIDHRQQRSETKEQSWTRTSNRLSQMWQELDAPLVLLAQLNSKMAVEHRTPSAAQVKDCGSLLEDACWTLVLDRPEADERRFAEAEKLRQKYERAGDHQDAHDCDVRGKIIASCEKDRNSTMGGTWYTRLQFDRRSGRIA